MFRSGNAFAADPPESEYQAALEAITDGAYYLVTEVNDTKYYVTQSGYLTDDKEIAYLFAISKRDASGAADKLFDTAWLIEPGNNSHFSNTTLVDNKALLHPTETGFRQDGGNNREDWERQIFYLNPETGLYAIRSCNTAYGEESWKDAGRAFWTYEIDESDPDYITLTPCYSYDVAYIWSLEVPAGKDQLYMVLEGAYNTYLDQFYDDLEEPQTVNMGTDFGQFADWDTWRKFKAELDKLDALVQKFADEDYDPFTDSDCPDLDGANAWKAELDSMWQKIVASEVPYKIPQDGYYRIMTRMRYYTEQKDEEGNVIDQTYVNKAMLASYDKNYPDEGMWGTLKDDRANFVWKLTQEGDSVLMQNVGMENFVSFESSDRLKLTKEEPLISRVMFDYAANDIVELNDFDSDYRDIFYIRLANQPRHAGRYVHQLNHNKGKDSGKDQELCFWNDTYNYGSPYETDGGTSEWYLEPVSEDEVAELIEKFKPILNHDVLVQENQMLRDEVLAAMTDAKDIIREDMITDAAQMSSPQSDSAEGTNIGALIDGDASTFWHSDWHGEKPEKMTYGEGEDAKSCDYVQVSGMQKMVGNCEFYLMQRNTDNDHPAEMVLMGSNDPEAADADWVEIAKIKINKYAGGEEVYVPFTSETPYEYVRILCTDTKNKEGGDSWRTFWHAAEIQISTVQDNPNSRFIALGEVATNLENVYNENCAIADDDIQYSDYEKLKNAYDQFKGALVDPTELRDALKKYAKVTTGVVEGNEPGQWASLDVPNAYDRLYGEAKAYNEAGKYTPVKVHKYASMLKAMVKSVNENVNGVKTGTWYHIMVPTEEMYDRYGFDKSPVGKSDLVEEQAYQYGNFAAVGEEVTEEGEPDDDGNPTEVHRIEAYEKANISDVTRMYFIADDEITDKDIALFRFVERPVEKANYTEVFSETKENMATALELGNVYAYGDALITDAAQLSSNASDEAEGKNIEYLIDGKFDTFWHTDWHKKVNQTHYLQVALDQPVSGMISAKITRRQGSTSGTVTRMYAVGSNDAENWTNIGYVEVPYGDAYETVTTLPVELGSSYSYLRFYFTHRTGLDIEFDPFEDTGSVNKSDVLYSYVHMAEFQLYPVKYDNAPTEGAKSLQQTLTSANKILLKDVTEEDFAAAKKAYKPYQEEVNTSVGKAVLPNGPEKPASSFALQNKATGMFIKANDGNTNDVFLTLTPTFFSYSAPGYERSLLHGVNINGNSCNYLHTGNSNHRVCTWSASEPYSNSALVIREVAAVEPAEFSFNLSIKNGEIYDFCSTVSIANKDEGVAYAGLGQFTDNDDESYLALKKVETIDAGAPAFYILGDTTQFDAEEEAQLVKFSMPAEPDFVLKNDTVNGFIACLINHPIGANDIYFEDNYASSIGKTGYNIVAPAVLVNLASCPEVDPTVDYDFAISLGGEDVVDGVKDVASVVKKISQPGDVYSIDGKLLKTGATLNNLKSLGTGMYILNGVKVLVK